MPRVAGFTYRDMCDDNMGWCPDCQDFTRDCTEPDAENYDCPLCGGDSVMGAEQALLLGKIDIYEEDDDVFEEE